MGLSLDYTFRQTKPAVLSVPGVGIAINAWGGENLQVFSGHANLGYDLRARSLSQKPCRAAPFAGADPARPSLEIVGTAWLRDDYLEDPNRLRAARLATDSSMVVNDEPFIPRPGHAPEFGGGETVIRR